MPYQLSDSLSIRARNLAFYELVAEKLKEQRICSLPPFNQTFFSREYDILWMKWPNGVSIHLSIFKGQPFCCLEMSVPNGIPYRKEIPSPLTNCSTVVWSKHTKLIFLLIRNSSVETAETMCSNGTHDYKGDNFMKTVSIINLKGGVAKTLTTVSMAYALSQQYNARVLVVDNDKQGNCSKTFGVHSYDRQSIADLMLDRDADLAEVIQHTKYDRIDVIPANMTLLTANMQVMMDSSRPQQTRLRTALRKVADLYDYCLIDNAPDINISTVNALVASDEAVIPVKIDSYAFDGLIELKNQIEITREELNPGLRLAGCLITCFQRQAGEQTGEDWLRENLDCPVYKTHIRYSGKVVGSSFECKPIIEYSKTSAAARDYLDFVSEFLSAEKRG